jgi:hypothetical protein
MGKHIKDGSLVTAEDILSKKFNELRSSFTLKDIEGIMIEFAQIHVEAALKEAVKCLPYDDKMNQSLLDERAILNSYSLENIK